MIRKPIYLSAQTVDHEDKQTTHKAPSKTVNSRHAHKLRQHGNIRRKPMFARDRQRKLVFFGTLRTSRLSLSLSANILSHLLLTPSESEYCYEAAAPPAPPRDTLSCLCQSIQVSTHACMYACLLAFFHDQASKRVSMHATLLAFYQRY